MSSKKQAVKWRRLVSLGEAVAEHEKNTLGFGVQKDVII